MHVPMCALVATNASIVQTLQTFCLFQRYVFWINCEALNMSISHCVYTFRLV